jgi:hypothetical protein
VSEEWVKIKPGKVVHVSKIVYLSWSGDSINVETENDYDFVAHGFEGPFIAILGPRPD